MNVTATDDDDFDRVPPGAALLQSLRSVGDSLPTAIADIVDNSIAAHAKTVRLAFEWNGDRSWIAMFDDGDGMAEDELRKPVGRSRRFRVRGNGEIRLCLIDPDGEMASLLAGLDEVGPQHIRRRSSQEVVMNHEQIYPCNPEACLLDDAAVREDWKQGWGCASAASWRSSRLK